MSIVYGSGVNLWCVSRLIKHGWNIFWGCCCGVFGLTETVVFRGSNRGTKKSGRVDKAIEVVKEYEFEI